jgi:soluble lytic murein transglycosylase
LFFLFSLYAAACAQPQIQKDFYQGLRSKRVSQSEVASRGEAGADTLRFFEKALNSSNVYIRQAAAEELADLMYEGAQLSAATERQMRREASNSWAAAFDAVGTTPNKEKVLAFLLNSGGDTLISNNAALYTMEECAGQEGDFFSKTESAAIDGHFADSRSRYNEALVFFRAFQEDGKWPDQIPLLFLQYPALLADLGRAFQYTASGGEGYDLFLQWEKTLGGGATPGPDEDRLRFTLLFYAARMLRRRGQTDPAIALFEKALPLAPEDIQADACIWYILDLSLGMDFNTIIQRLEQFIPQWHDDAYFDDILEQVSRELTSKKEWKNLIRVFTLIRERGSGDARARYAWIIARAIEEGYLTAEEEQVAARAALAAEAANAEDEALSAAFMRIAYSADTSFYYRWLSAAALSEPFLKLGEASRTKGKPQPALAFLLGFFSNDVPEYAMPHIRALEKELTPDELRALAEALDKAGMYAQSIRLVSQYIHREGYTPVKRDMELLFPQAFKKLVEKYADETGLDPALLYGLIRTESAFQSDIISRAGAMGLTQLIPSTAEEMAARIRRGGGPDYTAEDGGLDLNDPEVNIHLGAYYLSYLMGRFEDTRLSLLAYNGGMGRVQRWYDADNLPPDLFLESVAYTETRDYGRRVMAAAAVYQELYYSN